jgi:hypothetical protein
MILIKIFMFEFFKNRKKMMQAFISSIVQLHFVVQLEPIR